MGYFYRVVFIVLLASYVCCEINEDNEDSNVLEHIVWRQSTDVGELLADVKVIIMGQEQQIQQQQEFQQQLQQQQQGFQQQMQQQQQEFPQQIRQETQPLKEQLQQMRQQQQEFQQQLQEFQQQMQQQQQEFPQQIRREIHGCKTTERGREYAGTLTVTKSGKTCVRWNSKSHYTASQFPDATIAEAANYCRNPWSGSGGPYCWITDSSTEKCDVPLCL